MGPEEIQVGYGGNKRCARSEVGHGDQRGAQAIGSFGGMAGGPGGWANGGAGQREFGLDWGWTIDSRDKDESTMHYYSKRRINGHSILMSTGYSSTT